MSPFKDPVRQQRRAIIVSPTSAIMVLDEAELLSECRRLLKDKLDNCFARRDDPNPKKAFARRGITREIFEESRLERLFGLLLQSESNLVAHNDSFDLKRIAESIRGSGNSVTYCNVLATLLYSRCTNETLRRFSSEILLTEPGKPITDDDLPLTQKDAREAFGNHDGYQFWVDQYVFCPVVLKENDEARYVGNRASCPMPFIEEPVEIGKGAYAIVRKVVIEKDHLVNERDKVAHEVGLSR